MGVFHQQLQSIGVFPNSWRAVLALEKILDPMKGVEVLVADKGEG